ncbi:MAG TPA: ATP-binding protein [Candidatus Binatia bacterium]|jgi:signal transduction histidine kinase/CheY-like chemotaxis protein|nr:ATP-binding protein [Candidatus Binatia bacterium]
MILPILTVQVQQERECVAARQRARDIAAALGFDTADQTRLATALSEIVRNAYRYAGGGSVSFSIEGSTVPQVLVMRVRDQGPGIADVRRILDGRYQSTTGLGLGIVGSQRLMDRFEIESAPSTGTVVTLKKLLPRRAPLVTAERVATLVDALARQRPRDPLEEIQAQNQELLAALDELRRRQDELSRLNGELEDTNRGVVALYAELDERADHLRRADEMKTRFLSNMSHEFRTPVHAIQALAALLLEHADGPLEPEQETQVSLIRRAADDLSELVEDLLDLARVEAGKTVVRPTEFDTAQLFGALRGMLRPLLVTESVALVFEEPVDVPALVTDEGKVSQILRNLVSNALKFTARGEVRVSVRMAEGRDSVVFDVTDTGIGIADEDQERVFHEFVQVESPMQRAVRGTGLGLPLCRRLAALLGGSLTLESTVGVGSRFIVVIPRIYRTAPLATPEWDIDPERIAILIVEDDLETTMLYERYLNGSRFQPIVARSVRQARDAVRSLPIRAVVLDVVLAGEDTWAFLTELRRESMTQQLPILVATNTDDEPKALALGASRFRRKPLDRTTLRADLDAMLGTGGPPHILVVDDEEAARYVLRRQLTGGGYVVTEAANGTEALRSIGRDTPDLVCLDLSMPELDGYGVLRTLRNAPETAHIPVVVVTSATLTEGERRSLLEHATLVLSKHELATGGIAAALGQAVRSSVGRSSS